MRRRCFIASRLSGCLVALAIGVLLATVPAALGAVGYSIETLGNLGTNASGTTTSGAYGLNNTGDAIGQADKWSGNTSLGARAVRWVAGQTAATELGHLGTNASGVTDSGAAEPTQKGSPKMIA